VHQASPLAEDKVSRAVSWAAGSRIAVWLLAAGERLRQSALDTSLEPLAARPPPARSLDLRHGLRVPPRPPWVTPSWEELTKGKLVSTHAVLTKKLRFTPGCSPALSSASCGTRPVENQPSGDSGEHRGERRSPVRAGETCGSRRTPRTPRGSAGGRATFPRLRGASASRPRTPRGPERHRGWPRKSRVDSGKEPGSPDSAAPAASRPHLRRPPSAGSPPAPRSRAGRATATRDQRSAPPATPP